MSIKVFAIKALVFAVLLLGVDQLCGWGFRKLNTISGDKFAREEYIRHEMQEELLIFGSSRAAQHYVASVIADTLGVRGFNCGQSGNGIIYEYGRLQTILARYTPKYIIVDLFGGYDLEYCDNTRFLDFLKPDYGHNDSVDAIFCEIDPLSPLKMQLQSYRYNSTICDLLLNIVLRNRGRYREDGFFPLYGSMEGGHGAKNKEQGAIASIKLTVGHDATRLETLLPKSQRSPHAPLLFLRGCTYPTVGAERNARVKNGTQHSGRSSIPEGKMEVVPQTEASAYDPVKLKYMHKLVAEVPEGCELLFVISPCAETFNKNHIKEYQHIADEYGIRLLDYSRAEAFQNRPDLFRNPYHMNEEGATYFSTILASDLKKILQ